MEVALFLLSIVSCFAPIMGQTVSVAPMDIDTSCRNSFRTRAAHDWIPYVNDTSDGVRGEVKWQVILDQYDYSTLVEENPSLHSHWAVADFDGDGLTVCTKG